MKRLYFSLSILITILALTLTGSHSAQGYIANTASLAAPTQRLTDLGDLRYVLEYSQNSRTGTWSPDFDPQLTEFVKSVKNEGSRTIQGIYVRDVLSMAVIQQPAGNAGWVSETDNVITQFGMATRYNTTGLLAHNTHAGEKFSKLKEGQIVVVVNGKGKLQRYKISSIYRFQALQPNNPYSDFIDLETNQKLSATALFYQVYTGDHHLTFQTCIAQNGDFSWGRLFVLATPLD